MGFDLKNGRGEGVFISVSADVGGKGIKNLRNLPCGLHLFNGIEIGRQTERSV